jgi:hypothetical protein
LIIESAEQIPRFTQTEEKMGWLVNVHCLRSSRLRGSRCEVIAYCGVSVGGLTRQRREEDCDQSEEAVCGAHCARVFGLLGSRSQVKRSRRMVWRLERSREKCN